MRRWVTASALSALTGCAVHPLAGTASSAMPAPTAAVADTLPNCTNEFNCYVSTTADVCPNRKYVFNARTFATVVVEDSGMLVRSDGRGPYANGKDNVYSHLLYWANLSSNQERQMTINPSHGPRALTFDLRHPVPGSGASSLGVVADRYGELYVHLKAQQGVNINLADIPVGSTIPADETDLGVHIGGVIHNLSMGPTGRGTECKPDESVVHGRGTTSVTVSRPTLTKWIFDAPAGSIARLWDIHNTDLFALDRGLYYLSFHFTFTAQRPGAYLPAVEAARRGGADSVQSLFHQMKATGTKEWIINEGQLELVAAWFEAHNRPLDALSILQYNVSEYPTDPDAHASLAEAYLARADTTRAVASYRRAADLDPTNQRLRATLQRLRGLP